MLVILGTLMVLTFMYLIISKRTTPAVALILVPVAFGLFAGAGLDIGDMITDGVKDLAPTAALLFFAIIFFGVMIDVGLFDPLVRLILRGVRDDPMRLVVGTAVLAMVVSLDGDGSTTFIIVTSALLPLYLKLGGKPGSDSVEVSANDRSNSLIVLSIRGVVLVARPPRRRSDVAEQISATGAHP